MDNNQVFKATTLLNATQAKNELNELSKTYAALEAKKNRMIATDGKQAKGLKDVNNAIRETRTHMSALQTRLQEVDHVMSNLSTAGIKDIQSVIKKINAELRSGAVDRGSAEWRKLQEQLKACKSELKAINLESAESQSIFSRLGDGFNKYQTLALSAVASFTGVTLTVRQAVKAYADMEEEEYQVVKYTGMTKKEVEDLNEEFKKMDTRTAREKLNQLADDAGRLGITSKEGVMQFVEASDKINVALGDDLGDKATETIGKLAMMFGEDKKYGLNTAMLKTGSVINELSQSSSACGAYLADFGSRVAGVGKSAKLTQAQIMSYGSVLDQNMQQDEMAATAFSQLIQKMFLDPSKFAKLAGQDVKSFSALLKTDANAAILRFLSAMKAKGGFDTIAPMFAQMGLDGARATSVLSVMADKIGDITQAQTIANTAYEQGTSLTKEFNVQNNTVQASLDKANKRFKDLVINLGEKLEPIAKHTITIGSAGIKVLSDIVNWVSSNISVLTKLAVVIAAYYTAVAVATAWEKRYLVAKTLSTVADKAEIAMMAVKRTAIYATALVTNILTLNFNRARIALMALGRVTKMNPWGLAASAIAGIIVLVASLVNKTKELTADQKALAAANKDIRDSEKSAAESTVEIKNKIALLSGIIHDNTRSLSDRRAAILNMQKIIPNYNASLSNEGKITKENTGAIKEYLAQLEKKALAQALYEKLVSAMKKKADAELAVNIWENAISFRKGRMSEQGHESKMGMYQVSTGPGTSLITTGETNDTRINDNKLLAADQAGLKSNQQRLSIANKQIDIIRQYIKKKQLKNELETTVLSTPTDGTTTTTTDTDTGKKNNSTSVKDDSVKKLQEQRTALIKAIEDSAADERHVINMNYNQGLIDEQSYNNQMNKLKIDELTKKLDIEKKFGNKEQRLSAEQALKNEHNMQDEEAAKTIRDKKLSDEKKLQEDLQHIKEEYLRQPLADRKKIELDTLNALHKESIMSEEQYQQARMAILVKYKALEKNENQTDDSSKDIEPIHYDVSGVSGEFLKFFDMLRDKSTEGFGKFSKTASAAISFLSSSFADLSSYYQACSDEEVQATETRYEKEINAAGANTKKGKQLKEKEEKEIAAIKSKYAEKQANMQIAQTIASTALAAINAYASALQVGGPAGLILAPIAAAMAIAAGAIQIATVKKQAQVQQAGYFSGGYTGVGDYHAEAGVVHNGEFVLNHDAVNNPNLLPMIKIIDNAQRNNTVGSLVPDYSAAKQQNNNTIVVQNKDPEIVAALTAASENSAQQTLMIQLLNKQLEQGIQTYVVIDGPDGLDRQYKRYKKLNSNK